MSDRIISVAIPTYQRVDLLFESFAQVISNDNVGEIVIVDDASELDVYRKIEERAKENEKIKLFRNETNRDCYWNKYTAMSHATNDWCILLDSDNVIGFDYLYHLFQEVSWQPDTIYTPSFAEPLFDFRPFQGLTITKNNVANYINEPMFETMLNACNFFVNKKSYLKVWDGSVDPVTSDSIYFCLKWLEQGFKIKVVDGLTYHHRIHGSSHYNSNVSRTPVGFHESILNKLKNMA